MIHTADSVFRECIVLGEIRMIELGKSQVLTVVNQKEQGVYLGESRAAGPEERILLPSKQVPEGTKAGDEIEVFVYRDSMDRMIATTVKPVLEVGEAGFLKVRQVTKIGAFLDWGLEKDLLLPFHEQLRKVSEGEEILAAVYVDKSGRLAATMNVYPYLKLDSPYKKGDHVKGYVYQIARNFGTFVAVDGKYSGMIPKREPNHFRIGETVELRVAGVKEDGKLDLSARDVSYVQMNTDAETVFQKIRQDFGGTLPFDDKADPERIRDVFGMSKNAFKRAVGHLYKQHRVILEYGMIETKN